MKLSFSIPSKSSSKPSNSINPSQTFDHSSTNHDAPPSKHFVSEFDPSKPPTNPNSKEIIPPIQNEWKPHKKMRNLYLPVTDPNSTSQSLQFEHDTSSVEPDSDMSFGLNLRHSVKKNEVLDGEEGNDNEEDKDRVMQQNAPSVENVMLQKFKDDLERLPDHQGFDEFKDVPVEGFGKALLAGYGWSEGMGVGRNAKEDVKVVQYKRRTAKEGLGFVSADPVSSTQSKKNKEIDREGVKKENGRDDGGFGVGKIVRIVGGRDAGLKGSVLRRIADDWVGLKLSRSGEEVKVRMDDVAELGSVEEERCLRKLKELKIHHNNDMSSRSKRSRSQLEFEEKKRVDVNKDHRKEEQGKKKVSWLTSHIRVRVVSRDLKGGRLYLKKAVVLDVVGPTTCDISLDERKEIIQGVSQDHLETAIPRRGGPVLVLYGKYKGVYGSLVERDLDREIGIVKDADTHELLNVRLEQIAEYMGDPSLLGH